MRNDISGDNNPMKNPIIAKKQGQKMIGDKNPMKRDVVKKKQSESWKKRWNEKRDECVGKIKNGMNKSLVKEKISVAKKKNWQDENYKRKVYVGWNVSRQGKMNKAEKRLFNIIKNIGFVFTGDFSFMIGNKNPDFINFDNKMVIEMFGDIFHTQDEAEQRVKYMNQYGFDCLIIWCDEINKNLSKVEQKIFTFIKNKGWNKDGK